MKMSGTKTKVTTPIAALVGALLVSGVFAAAPAFADQAYLAGYPDTTTVTKVEIFSAKTDFSGTTTSVPRSGNLVSAFSTAGFSSLSASNPNSWVHQHGVALMEETNNVRGIYQVYHQNVCVGDETCVSGGDPGVSLGTHGTSSSHINYVYSLFSVDADFVNHQYEAVRNSGSVLQEFREFDKDEYGDPTDYFSIGTKNRSISGDTWKVKFYQFGIESSEQVTQNFNVLQYDLLYDTGNLANIDARTIDWCCHLDDSSIITYWGTTGKSFVGGEAYSDADGDSDTDGEVDWFDGTMPAGGTLLWS